MSNRTVLLVEDEMLIGIELQLGFEDDGWKVDGPYATAAQALTAIKVDKPDCAVLDVGLIDADVFSAADRLIDLGIPFLFHTGQRDVKELNQRYPDVPLISKPASPSVVVKTAEALTSLGDLQSVTPKRARQLEPAQ